MSQFLKFSKTQNLNTAEIADISSFLHKNEILTNTHFLVFQFQQIPEAKTN